MSPNLSTGTFIISTSDSSRYVAADSSSTSGEPVKTADALDSDNPDNYRFTVTGDSGRVFANVANGLYLIAGTDDSGNSIVVWSESTYNWAVPNSDVGIWDIKDFGANSYWSGDASNDTIPLVPKAGEGDRIQWTFTAA
jgi:hypothetical protein